MTSRVLATAMLVAATVAGVAALSASAAGPAPQVLQGEPGIAVAGGMHVVALAGPNASSTRIWLVRNRDGKTIRKSVINGKLGVPAVTFNGVAEGTWERLKACERDVCRWAFYDHSKNRSSHWCSMAVCGQREKNRRAYRRRVSAGIPCRGAGAPRA